MSEEREALARDLCNTPDHCRGQCVCGDCEERAKQVWAAGWRRSPQPADPRVAEIRIALQDLLTSYGAVRLAQGLSQQDIDKLPAIIRGRAALSLIPGGER